MQTPHLYQHSLTIPRPGVQPGRSLSFSLSDINGSGHFVLSVLLAESIYNSSFQLTIACLIDDLFLRSIPSISNGFILYNPLLLYLLEVIIQKADFR